MAEPQNTGLLAMPVEPRIVPRVPQVPGLLASSSNVSTATVETDVTAPIVMDDQHVTVIGNVSLESASPNSLPRHDLSSSEDADEKSSSVDSFPLLAETTTEVTAAKKGAKRTASGAVKETGMVRERNAFNSSTIAETSGRERRASELNEQLKTRLKYAMLKVQHGWESQSLDEIETNAITAESYPNSPVFPSSRRRSLSSEGYITSPIVHNLNPSRAFQNSIAFGLSSEDTSPVTAFPPSSLGYPEQYGHNHHLTLAPAARISSSSSSATRKQQNRRSLNEYGRRPPSLMKSSYSTNLPDMPGMPTTPKYESQPGLSMLPNQAEMDAVDTLLFMSSPGNSGNMKKSTIQRGGAPSMERKESVGKRVNFRID